ncbi:hypothetical protein BJ742DRAFT_834649 [Cladochytrium replicatum]|nr:hypothetical protein BJ742DRAFT_834649 [Cladochytrium replicatum]
MDSQQIPGGPRRTRWKWRSSFVATFIVYFLVRRRVKAMYFNTAGTNTPAGSLEDQIYLPPPSLRGRAKRFVANHPCLSFPIIFIIILFAWLHLALPAYHFGRNHFHPEWFRHGISVTDGTAPKSSPFDGIITGSSSAAFNSPIGANEGEGTNNDPQK